MVKAVEANVTCEQRWIVLYVKRWLAAPIRTPEGGVVGRDRGTPHGSAIGPLMCNVYLHRLDRAWDTRTYGVLVRFADDGVPRTLREAAM